MCALCTPTHSHPGYKRDDRPCQTALAPASQDRATLVKLFGTTRDDWIQEDLKGWLAPNRFYDGVVEPVKKALGNEEREVYIVTTKQQRFTVQVRMS